MQLGPVLWWEDGKTQQLITVTKMFYATGPCAVEGGRENKATYHGNIYVLCNWALCSGGRMGNTETYNGNKDVLCNWALCCGGRMGKHSNLSR